MKRNLNIFLDVSYFSISFKFLTDFHPQFPYWVLLLCQAIYNISKQLQKCQHFSLDLQIYIWNPIFPDCIYVHPKRHSATTGWIQASETEHLLRLSFHKSGDEYQDTHFKYNSIAKQAILKVRSFQNQWILHSIFL